MSNDRIVGFTERGNRVGETHHRAKLTDHDIDLLRDLWERKQFTFDELVEKFEISRGYCSEILRYTKRAAPTASWGKIKKKPKS